MRGSFQTVFFASTDTANVGDHDGDMSETLSVSLRIVERDLSTLRTKGLLKRKDKDNTDSVSDKLSDKLGDKQQLSDNLSDKSKVIAIVRSKIAINPKFPDNTTMGVEAIAKMTEILQYISMHSQSKTETISNHFGLSKQAVRVYLQKLSEIGLIEPHGANKNRTYSLGDILEEETSIIEE